MEVVIFFVCWYFPIYILQKKIIAISSFSHSFIPLVLFFSLSASYTHIHTHRHTLLILLLLYLSLSLSSFQTFLFLPRFLFVCVCCYSNVYTTTSFTHFYNMLLFFFDDHLSFTFSNTATILCYCCNWCCIYSFRFVSYTHICSYPIHHYFYV